MTLGTREWHVITARAAGPGEWGVRWALWAFRLAADAGGAQKKLGTYSLDLPFQEAEEAFRPHPGRFDWVVRMRVPGKDRHRHPPTHQRQPRLVNFTTLSSRCLAILARIPMVLFAPSSFMITFSRLSSRFIFMQTKI